MCAALTHETESLLRVSNGFKKDNTATGIEFALVVVCILFRHAHPREVEEQAEQPLVVILHLVGFGNIDGLHLAADRLVLEGFLRQRDDLPERIEMRHGPGMGCLRACMRMLAVTAAVGCNDGALPIPGRRRGRSHRLAPSASPIP